MTFLLISIICFYVIVFFMPKRISKIEIYTNTLFGLIFAILTDMYLDVKYQWYWFFMKEVDWLWLIVIFGTYPPVHIVFLNYFPLASTKLKKFGYILLWSGIITCYEWGSVHIGKFLHYEQWTLWYSALAYPFILSILYGNFIFVRKIIRKT